MPESQSPETATTTSPSSGQSGKAGSRSAARGSKKRGNVQPTLRRDVIAIESIGWRAEDEAECIAMSGKSCAENCYMALDTTESETYTIMNEGYPVGMFGVVPVTAMNVPPGIGCIWLLASPALYEVKRDFVRQCPRWLDHLQRYYPTAINYVHVANKPALTWCKAMGFSFGVVHKAGVAGENFIQITRRLYVPDHP